MGSAAGATPTQIGERFFRTTFQVMGHVAKADGRVSEQEIQAARAVMSQLRLTPDAGAGGDRLFHGGQVAAVRLEHGA